MINNNNDDDDDNDMSLSDFFICEEYKEINYEIVGLDIDNNNEEISLIQKVLASTMSSTDHDLTGQIVWPASLLLSTFLLCNKNNIFLQNNNNIILELGAGCGLTSFCISNFNNCNNIIVTDGNDIVIRLLKKSKEKYDNNNKIDIIKLIWGIKSEIKKLDKIPNIILGADVLLWPNHTRALLLTIKWLMRESYINNNQIIPITYISYIVRANSTTILLFQSANELGLNIEIMPLNFLKSPEPLCLENLEKMILKITIKDMNTINDESYDNIEEENCIKLGSASAPC